MQANAQTIPKELIYEMVDGSPIYYKGYQAYLKGTKQIGELMGSRLLQSDIITRLVLLLGTQLSKGFKILTNEIGLQFAQNSWRAADIAIIEKAKLEQQVNPNKYLEMAPDVVIEIDIKASIKDLNDASSYFHKKTDQLLDFGVKKVIWIFTDSEKVMIAEKDQPWQTINWDNSFEIIEGVEANIASLIQED